ncbi:MAG: site-2 protease family protein [Candidatus Saganbacteria bacterium]|nr:site-2 protease family protein [Candidatus Saganbacteria bacterium]
MNLQLSKISLLAAKNRTISHHLDTLGAITSKHVPYINGARRTCALIAEKIEARDRVEVMENGDFILPDKDTLLASSPTFAYFLFGQNISGFYSNKKLNGEELYQSLINYQNCQKPEIEIFGHEKVSNRRKDKLWKYAQGFNLAIDKTKKSFYKSAAFWLSVPLIYTITGLFLKDGLNLFPFLASLFITITIHELGHAIEAVRQDFPFNNVRIGMGYPLSLFRMGKVDYEINSLPFDGAVASSLESTDDNNQEASTTDIIKFLNVTKAGRNTNIYATLLFFMALKLFFEPKYPFSAVTEFIEELTLINASFGLLLFLDIEPSDASWIKYLRAELKRRNENETQK